MKTSIIKKLGNKILAAATGAAVFVSAYAPTLASAAEEVPLYISEVYLSYGETPDKAKQWLTDNGYTVLDQDLNEEADGLMSTKRSVYLGYNTTTDKDEAITDMRAMNMNGDYSFDDYEKLLISKKAEITGFINNMKVALSEYRENYKKGAVKAQISHDRMNQALDDDCGFGGLGDLLLEPVREEMSEADYNKEPDKHVDLTTVIMQGNLDSVNALMSDLCLAADTSGNGWIARLKESGSDRLYDRYEAEYPELSESKLSALIQSEYDDEARVFAQKLAELKESLEIYTNAAVKAESEPEEITKYFEEHPDLNFNDWSMAATVYVILSGIKYGSGTLLDLVNGDKYDFDNEDDRSTLYPILDVMSAGQRSLLSYVDLGELVIMCNLEGEGWTETQEKANAILKTALPESVYAGIDRTAFQPGGIALTSQARAIQSATGSSYATKILGVSARTLEYVGAASTLIVLAAGICSFKYGNTQIVVKELKYREIASDPELVEKLSSCLDDLNESREQLGAKIQEFMLNNGYSSFDSVTPDMHSITNRIIVKATPHNHCASDAQSDFSSDCLNSTPPCWRKARRIWVI